MEEYEIRQLYGRKVVSRLILDRWSIKTMKRSNEGVKAFLFEAIIANDGDVTEKDYKLNVYFNNFHGAMNLSWDRSKTNYDYTWLDDNNRLKVSAISTGPIFPDEQINGIRFTFEVPLNKVEEVFNKVSIEAILLYPNGDSKLTGDMKQLLDGLHKEKEKDELE